MDANITYTTNRKKLVIKIEAKGKVYVIYTGSIDRNLVESIGKKIRKDFRLGQFDITLAIKMSTS